MPFDALVLAGATSARLDGSDKALVTVGGESLLELVLGAVSAAERIIVVGPQRDVAIEATWVQEEPPGAGPVAALAAGLRLVRSTLVVVSAVDHPLVTDEDISRLLASVSADGAIAVSDDGRLQPLLAAYRHRALTLALERLPSGGRRPSRTSAARVWELVGTLDLARVDLGLHARDCDTWADIEAVRELADLKE
jgi:molybdopterin-guanine dinucleotide biosynthesis protein A